MSVVKKGERTVTVGDQQAIGCRLENDEDGKFVGYLLKLLPAPPEIQPYQYFTSDAMDFHVVSNSIEEPTMRMIKQVGALETDQKRIKLLHDLFHEWKTAAKKYKNKLHTFNPVAVKQEQGEVHAPDHDTWEAVTCPAEGCNQKFAVGYNRIYGDRSPQTQAKYVKRTYRVLTEDHRRGNPHRNAYDLGE